MQSFFLVLLHGGWGVDPKLGNIAYVIIEWSLTCAFGARVFNYKVDSNLPKKVFTVFDSTQCLPSLRTNLIIWAFRLFD